MLRQVGWWQPRIWLQPVHPEHQHRSEGVSGQRHKQNWKGMVLALALQIACGDSVAASQANRSAQRGYGGQSCWARRRGGLQVPRGQTLRRQQTLEVAVAADSCPAA